MKYVITNEFTGKTIKEFLRMQGVSGGLLKKLKKSLHFIIKNVMMLMYIFTHERGR